MIRKNSLISLLLLAVVFTMLLGSCENSAKKYEKEEEAKIQAYLDGNPTLNFVLKPGDLHYLEIKAGTGQIPVLYDSAYVIYTGKFLDGSIFNSNAASGKLYGFIVGFNIVGFDEGVMLMGEGGKSTLLIPSKLAYGSTGDYYGVVPGFTPLLFDLELVRVKAGPFK